MKVSLPSAVTSKFSRQLLVAEKHSPQLLFGAGIVLGVSTVVTACKATLKLEDVLDEAKKDRDVVEEMNAEDPNRYTDAQYRKLQTYIVVKNAYRVFKLYTPTLVLGSLAVASLTSSHHIMNKRNAGLSAALAATDKALKNYRERVREEFGDEKDLELFYGKEDAEVSTFNKKGEVTGTKTIARAAGKSQYAVFFGRDTTSNWNPQPEYNLAFLCAQQEFANNRLRAKGHLFLNDVYDALGMPRTPAGSQVGWLWQKGTGNDWVDFGAMTGDMSSFLEFVTGHEDGIWLDFNVDGEIWRNI